MCLSFDQRGSSLYNCFNDYLYKLCFIHSFQSCITIIKNKQTNKQTNTEYLMKSYTLLWIQFLINGWKFAPCPPRIRHQLLAHSDLPNIPTYSTDRHKRNKWRHILIIMYIVNISKLNLDIQKNTHRATDIVGDTITL